MWIDSKSVVIPLLIQERDHSDDEEYERTDRTIRKHDIELGSIVQLLSLDSLNEKCAG